MNVMDLRPADDRPALRQDGAYAWLVATVLLVAYTFAFIDRQVMNLLVEPIRTTFALNDTRVSLLLGAAFVVAYALAAPLGGRLADTGHRRNICLAVVTAWSLCTVACGLAPSYQSLFAARFAVGASEALLMPAAWSLIADHFSRARLPRAMSLFLLGPYVGGGFALILGGAVVRDAAGWSAAIEPWRLTFILAGTIGLLPAVLLLLVREPARARTFGAANTAPPLRQVLAHLASQRRFYGGFYGGVSLQTITFYAFPAWMPTYLTRHFGVPLGTIGLHYGAVTLVLGCLGVLCSPFVARAISARAGTDGNMHVAAWSSTLIAPLAIAVPLVRSYEAALVLVALVTFIGSLPMPTNAAALQLATPQRMRGIASSIYMFAVSFVGVAIPPTLIALLTDHVFHSPQAVGQSLAIVCLVASMAAGLVLWATLRGYRAALLAAEAAA